MANLKPTTQGSEADHMEVFPSTRYRGSGWFETWLEPCPALTERESKGYPDLPSVDIYLPE